MNIGGLRQREEKAADCGGGVKRKHGRAEEGRRKRQERLGKRGGDGGLW